MHVQKNPEHGTVDADKRGKHNHQKKINEEINEQRGEHIQSFPTIEAHYVRKDSAHKYLVSRLNICKMHRMYMDCCTDRNYDTGKC